MHGALDDDLSVTPSKGEYHFYSLDIVYDNMLKHGVRPIVELSFMPAALGESAVASAISASSAELRGAVAEHYLPARAAQ
jgi:hypothetical protein